MNLEKIIQNHITAALKAEFDVEENNISLQPTKKDFEGSYTFVARLPLQNTLNLCHRAEA